MKRLLGLMVAVLCGKWAYAEAPAVTNVYAGQRPGTKLVDIRYDVFDPDNDPLIIRVEISSSGGTNYVVPAFTFSGDIGANITPGTNKLITWNAEADWNGEFSTQMRVKVVASDRSPPASLQWGQEVPPGGFLMGQDGGAEGAGPSRQIHIPWSYALGKFEITVGQFVEFLNAAHASGEITRQGNFVSATGVHTGVPNGFTIYTLGSDIQWSVVRYQAAEGRSQFPVMVNWYGALSFAMHYRLDLPTEAEWEKAARGAEFDDAGEHRVYPWGNTLSGGHANFLNSSDPHEIERTPVGFYNGAQVPTGPDTANPYGLYDLTGNISEWTRTQESGGIENYPATESLSHSLHSFTGGALRVHRGGHFNNLIGDAALRCHGRAADSRNNALNHGFRVIRRSP